MRPHSVVVGITRYEEGKSKEQGKEATVSPARTGSDYLKPAVRGYSRALMVMMPDRAAAAIAPTRLSAPSFR